MIHVQSSQSAHKGPLATMTWRRNIAKCWRPSDDSRAIHYKPRVFMAFLYLDILRIFVFKEMLGSLGQFIFEDEGTNVLKGQFGKVVYRISAICISSKLILQINIQCF